MAREISPICGFIFGSIHTGLPTDTVDMELTIQMVKGIYTYRKGHMAESMVFSPQSRTVIPFPSLCKKSKHSKMKTGRHQHGIRAMLCLTFPPNPSQNADIPWVRPGLDGLMGGIGLT